MKTASRFSALAMACLMGALSLSASAAIINKNSGQTTPTISDFGPAFANHVNKVGYNSTSTDGMFIETFRTPCGQGQHVSGAQFHIKVKKLSQGANGGDNDALAFWDNQTVGFNTYLWTSAEPAGTVKVLSFNLSALAPVGAGVINSPNNGGGGSGLSLLSDGDFSFSVQDDTAVLEAGIEYGCAADTKKGVTWGLYPAQVVTGTAMVSCLGSPGPNCDAYNGDTLGSVALPVLCFNKQGLPNPAPNTIDSGYWSGGVIATTPPVSPLAQNWTQRSQVDAYCVNQFGTGWVVAEHHMGGNLGWKFSAYGNVGQPGAKRFWVNVNNQPNANLWNQN